MTILKFVHGEVISFRKTHGSAVSQNFSPEQYVHLYKRSSNTLFCAVSKHD